jgi:L-asparagine transporter-like permease
MSAVARRLARILGFVLTPIFVLLSFVRFSQTTVGTGGIVGTASSPFGAVISGAKVTITDIAKGQVIELATNSSGSFNSGTLKKRPKNTSSAFA